MIRFLLALLLAFVTVATPARALCSYENVQTEACCCSVAEASDCAELQGSCCTVDDPAPAAPAPVRTEVSQAPVLVLPAGGSVAMVAVDSVVAATEVADDGVPLHLASNKVYLLRRRLLN